MSRPITWALGTVLLIGVSFAGTSERLAQRLGMSEPAPDATLNTARVEDQTGPAVLKLHANLSGHFVVHPTVDGRRVRMLVDTGASLVSLSEEDARTLGIRVAPNDFTRTVSTANGNVSVAPVKIRELRVGEIVVRNVDAVVVPAGRLGTSLLGMSFLKKLGGFEISRGVLTLRG